jgi:fatty acid desaturase
MKAFESIKITDPFDSRKNHYNVLEKKVIGILRDDRDLPFIHLMLRISLTMLPLGILLFFTHGWLWWVIAAVYFYLNHVYFKGPFGLMLHCTSHRPLFKPEYGYLNHYLPWIVAPFFGHSPETYFAHHIGMHHAENNLSEDESSTMQYQRDSLRDFLKYFANFFFFGIFTVYNYHKKRKRKYFMHKILAGELSFWALAIVLGFINFPATFMVFLFPFLIFRLVAMVGNWAQHAFVDADDPGNHYKNSVTCINHKYNHKCWNDGYHISHHILPNKHWTEHPQHLVDHPEEYAQNKALVFEGIDFLGIFALVIRRRYDLLAKRLVNINHTFASEEEAIALMKDRTKKIVDSGVPQIAS